MRVLSHVWRCLGDSSTAWAARQHSDLWKLLLITYFIVLGAHQLLKPFCAGESHLLPGDSLLARLYPCDGNILHRLWAILAHPWAFWRDLLFLNVQGKWATLETYFLLPRICCVLFLPMHVYESVAPVLAAVHRGLGPATLVVLSLVAPQRPDGLALWAMKTWPFMDIGFNAMFPTTPTVELVYGVFSLASAVTLCLRYKEWTPETEIQLPWRIMACLSSTCWLVFFQLYRRRCLSKKQQLLYPELVPGAKADDLPSGSSSMTRQSHTFGRNPALVQDDRQATSLARRLTPNHEEPAVGSRRNASTPPIGGHVPYNPLPGRHYTIYLKIGNADPEQLREGFKERIALQLADAGLKMRELYVRRGCIELAVDASTACNESDFGNEGDITKEATLDVGIGALIRALGLDGNEQEENDMGKIQLHQDSTTEAAVSYLGRAETLSLQPVSRSAASFGDETRSEPRLLVATCHPWILQQIQEPSTPVAPRITSVHPRVVASPPPSPSSRSNAAPTPQAMNMVVSVLWPTSSPYGGAGLGSSSGGNSAATAGGNVYGNPSREIVLRSQGLYLPVVVDNGDDMEVTTGGAAHADASPFWRSDSSNAPDVAPRQRFTYNVQVSGLPPCTGLLLAEARLDGRSSSQPVPILIVDDVRVSDELFAAFVNWAGSDSELDALTVDLATFLSEAAGTRACPLLCTGNTWHIWRLSHMGNHLLQYTLACGWQHTAKRIRMEMQVLSQMPATGPSCASDTIALATASNGDAIQPLASGACKAPASHAHAESATSQEPAPDSAGAAQCGAASKAAIGEGFGASSLGASVEVARRHVIGACDRAGVLVSQERTEARQDQGAPFSAGGSAACGVWWNVVRSCVRSTLLIGEIPWGIVIMELGVHLFPHVWRGVPPGIGALLVGCAGVLAGALYLQRLNCKELSKMCSLQPRLTLYLLARSLQGLLSLASPAAMLAYERGVGFLLMEGIARSAVLMVESAAAARIEVMKFALYVLLRSSTLTPWVATARAAMVAGLSLATSFICNRLDGARWGPHDVPLRK